MKRTITISPAATMFIIFAALFLSWPSPNTTMAGTSELKLATGGSKGNYYFSGRTIADQCRGSNVVITVLETKGSIDNLNKMVSGEADAAIVQADSLRVFFSENPDMKLSFDRTGVLYNEYAHLVCNGATGIKGIKDLDSAKHTVLVGDHGSGVHTTWKSFGLQDASYKKIPTKNIGDVRALSMILDGTEAQCMLWVGGLNAGFMTKIDAQGAGLRLCAVDDWDFNDMKDEKGKKVYEFKDIPSGTYKKNLQTGFFGSSVETIAVPAILITRSEWIEKNPDAYNDFINGYLSGRAAILQRVGGQ